MKNWKHYAFAGNPAPRFGRTEVPLCIVAILICGFVFTGCKDGSTGGTGVSVVAVTGITLEGDANFSLAVGANKLLSYTMRPANATNKAVKWESSNTDVAIASEGVVYAIDEGDATITVTTLSGYKTATWTVTVTKPIAVTGVEIGETAFSLLVGGSKVLTPTFHPANATNRNVRWISYNTVVATVTAGTVRGVGAGKTTIVVIAEDGGFEAACTVTVNAVVPPSTFDDMVWIYPGTFMMGSPTDEPESYDDEVLHQVTLTEGFFMCKYQVTQGQYFEIMKENRSIFSSPSLAPLFTVDMAKFPVEMVSWYKAIVYCNLLSMKEGFSPAYSLYKYGAPNATSANPANWEDEPENWSTNPAEWGTVPEYGVELNRWDYVRVVAGSNGYRLPTEAQWEYACRAGTITPFNTGNDIAYDQANYWVEYPYNNGGQREPDLAVFDMNQPIPVGKYPPNGNGLYDMHGNVWEWCWDCAGSYRVAANTDPTGPNVVIRNRIVRGGSWDAPALFLRSAVRDAPVASYYTYDLGFRLVRPYGMPSASRKAVTQGGTVETVQEGKTVPAWNFDRTDRTSASSVRHQALRQKAVIAE